MYPSATAAVEGTAGCACFAPLPSARRDVPDATLIAQIATGGVTRRASIGSSCASSAMRRAATTSPARFFSRFGGVHTSFGGTPLRLPGCLRLRASRRSRNCGAGATPRPTWNNRTRAIPLPIRKHPGQTSIAARHCASAWARSRPNIARSSTSFITTRNRCKRSRRSSGFRVPP
jgi:hypothetical protein